MPFFLCWFCLVSQAVPVHVLFLYLLFFLHRLSLFGRCWRMYKELWQRAGTALTHACLPSHSLSIAGSQTHAHVRKTHTHTCSVNHPHCPCLCVQQAKYFLFQPSLLSSSLPFSFCQSSCSCHAWFQDKPPSGNKRGLSVSCPHARTISFSFSSN